MRGVSGRTAAPPAQAFGAQLSTMNYSYRSATIGYTRVARRN